MDQCRLGFQQQQQQQNPCSTAPLKANLAFIGGSLFTPYLHPDSSQRNSTSSFSSTPDLSLQLWEEMKNIYNVALIYCKADVVTLQKRLVEEILSSGKTEVTKLPDFDVELLSQQLQHYSNFFEGDNNHHKSTCDAILHTTSTKQATASLLAFLQISVPIPNKSQTSSPNWKLSDWLENDLSNYFLPFWPSLFYLRFWNVISNNHLIIHDCEQAQSCCCSNTCSEWVVHLQGQTHQDVPVHSGLIFSCLSVRTSSNNNTKSDLNNGSKPTQIILLQVLLQI